MSTSLADADLTLLRDFCSPARAEEIYQRLLEELCWQTEEVRIFGKPVAVPRLVAWYGDDNTNYRYAGVSHQPLPWVDVLRELRLRLEQICAHGFNSVLGNRYRGGGDAMGWHADDEPELGREPVIASLSFGATRRMRFRHRKRTQPPIGIDLPAGSLLIMRGKTQQHWQHCITRTARPVGERVNLTFRWTRTPGDTSDTSVKLA